MTDDEIKAEVRREAERIFREEIEFHNHEAEDIRSITAFGLRQRTKGVEWVRSLGLDDYCDQEASDAANRLERLAQEAERGE